MPSFLLFLMHKKARESEDGCIFRAFIIAGLNEEPKSKYRSHAAEKARLMKEYSRPRAKNILTKHFCIHYACFAMHFSSIQRHNMYLRTNGWRHRGLLLTFPRYLGVKYFVFIDYFVHTKDATAFVHVTSTA